MIPSKNTITVDDMCRQLGIETVEDFDLRTMDNCQCHSKGDEVWDPYACKYVVAEYDYTCESCSFDYRGKVIQFYSQLLEKFDLKLDGDESNLTWKIVPKRGWFRAAKELIETINGYGIFHFGSVSEGIRSGPYEGSRGFVLNHLGWIPEYYNVYEGSKASSMFKNWISRK